MPYAGQPLAVTDSVHAYYSTDHCHISYLHAINYFTRSYQLPSFPWESMIFQFFQMDPVIAILVGISI